MTEEKEKGQSRSSSCSSRCMNGEVGRRRGREAMDTCSKGVMRCMNRGVRGRLVRTRERERDSG